jgi:hypothetical protein
LVAAHEVEHDVFQSRLECLWVNEVEVDLIISCNLYTLVSFDKVDKTSHVKLVVLLPENVGLGGVVLVLFFNNFEKHDLTGRSGDKSFVINKIHLSEILISHLLKLGLLSVITTDDESLTLSVEGVDLIIVGVVETLVWEVFG